MWLCADVDYRWDSAIAAGVLFLDWETSEAYEEIVERIDRVEEYVPGEFYRRELPCLLKLIMRTPEIEGVIIDGYVWLDENLKAGLGGHLYEALDRKLPVVGVAKSRFTPAMPVSHEVYRGESEKPLYVTTAGIDLKETAQKVENMHGPYRNPTLLKLVDTLCRNS